MVICLPSKHEGGSVHLSHGGRDYVFETDEKSAFGLTTLSWFSDVTHEVKPLKSGYRLVLTYNIVHTGGPRMSANAIGGQSDELHSILSKWQAMISQEFDGEVHKLIYKLDHKYTESSLALKNLKGRDYFVCQSLYEVGLECGFFIFLAQLNRSHKEEGYDDYFDDDCDNDQQTDLECIKTWDGHTICRSIEVQEEDILGKIWNRRADSEVEGGFTGNASMPSTLRYHDIVIIVYTVDNICYIPISDLAPRVFVDLVHQILDHRPKKRFPTSAVFKSLESLVQSNVSDSTLTSDILDMAIKYENQSLYRETVSCSLSIPDTWLKVLGKIFQYMKDEQSKDGHKTLDWDSWFGGALEATFKPTLPKFQEAMNQAESMLQKDEDLNDMVPSFQDRKLLIPDKMIKSKHQLDVDDLDFLKSRMFSQPDDHEWLTWFMGILPKRGTRKLICEILQALYEKRDDDIFTIAQGLFKFLVTKSANKLALQAKDFPASSYVPGSRRPPKDPSQPVSITRCIIEVIDQAFDMGLDKQATGLLDKSCINICQCCPKSGSNSAPDPLIVRDFLLCLFTMLQKHQFTPPTSLKVMFVALLRNILVCNPPECPKPPRGWAHKPRPKCHQYSYPCADCNTLNRFLEDPDMEAGGFRMTLNRQQHLIYQLPDSLYYYQTETNPPKLIVYKLGNEYKQEMHVYKARLTLFEDHVRALRCDYVKSLLSEELYNELVLLKDIPDSDGSMQTKRGEKRKPEEEGDGSSASRPQLIE